MLWLIGLMGPAALNRAGHAQSIPLCHLLRAGRYVGAVAVWLPGDRLRCGCDRNGSTTPFPILAAATAAGAFIEPARYGFHATLKAPFELAPCTDEATLLAAADAFATSVRPFSLGRLAVAKLDRFIALVAATPPAELSALAGRSVREFDRFRAPLSATDRERRLKAPLSAAEIAHLDRWGYPYVFERFQFHMTLSGLLAPEHSEPLLSELTALHAPIDTDAILDGIAVFK